MADDLVLYGNSSWTSPYVFSAFVCLEEKALPYRMELLDLDAGQHRRPEYAGPSITGRVPALRHGDFWVAESSAIDEYLEDAFPPPQHAAVYPADPRDRARARMVQAFVRSDLADLRQERTTATLFSGEAPKPLSAAGKAAADRLVAIAERLVRPGARHLAGAFGVADADLALVLQRLVNNGDPVTERLATYARDVFKRPSIRKWLSHTKWTDR
jgi:glutathione S-transferase